jgi:hypothetical protein
VKLILQERSKVREIPSPALSLGENGSVAPSRVALHKAVLKGDATVFAE